MKPLKRIINPLYHYSENSRVDGPNPKMFGKCMRLRGDCSAL